MKVGVCLWVRPVGWLGRSAHPLGGAERRGHAQCPALAPNTKLSLLFTQSGLAGLLFATLCDPRDCSTAGFPPCPSLSPRVGCSKVAVGFLVSLYLWVQNLPQMGRLTHRVIFSLIQFLCILLLEASCVQVQPLPLCSREPQVSAYLCFIM